MPHAAHPYRQLFTQLLGQYNDSLGGPPVAQAMDALELRVGAACAGVEFTLEHSLARFPDLLRMVYRFGPLPTGVERQAAMVRLLEIQHAMALRDSMLSVDPATGDVFYAVALPLARIDVEDLKQAMRLAHARALEWRDTRFLNLPGEEDVVAKAAELVLAHRATAAVH